jgi:hypothetical protein
MMLFQVLIKTSIKLRDLFIIHVFVEKKTNSKNKIYLFFPNPKSQLIKIGLNAKSRNIGIWESSHIIQKVNYNLTQLITI